METAIYRSYFNGYYTFIHEEGEITYEEIEPTLLRVYDLKNDHSLIGKTFEIDYTEVITDDQLDFVIFRITHLNLVD